MAKCVRFIWLLLLVVIFVSCNVTKFVPEDRYLLNKVRIDVKDTKDVAPAELKDYVRQKQNTEVLGFWKLQLHIYNTAPLDTTTKSKKSLAENAHRVGEAPQIFDPEMADMSVTQLERAMQNKGYFDAHVDTSMTIKNRKLNLDYKVTANLPYTLRNCRYSFSQNELKGIAKNSRRTLLKEGMLFDADVLDSERQRISSAMRRMGYYYFEKGMLRYVADSALQSRQVDVEMSLQPYIEQLPDSQKAKLFRKYTIRSVNFHMDYDPEYIPKDEDLHSEQNGNYNYTWVGSRLLRERTLRKNCSIRPADLFNERNVEDTYAQLNGLGIIKYVDITFDQVGEDELDCHIVLSRTKLNSVEAELGGTYSAGDWGIAAGVNYMNKNIFRGAEVLLVGGRGSYEWRQNGGRAIEAKANASLTFPNRLKVGVEYNYQTRPDEFTRTIANAVLSYTLPSNSHSRWHHTFNFADISYVYLPWISDEFYDQFLQPTNIMRYTYEDHFITAFSYICSYSSYRSRQPYHSYGAVNFQVETSGNLLNGVARLAKVPTEEDGTRKIFNIQYSQYTKLNFDFVYNAIANEKHRVVFHGALGAAIPYGNSNTIPFEKRYFSGGGNSVRGWTVRSLGPGGYRGSGTRIDYNNQSGDVRLDLNMEYRWVVWNFVELAAFTDAGNIWTIDKYESQPHGDFQWNRFYKEIAWSYGAGLRLNLSFMVLRLDFGFKLYDPSRLYYDQKQWRTIGNGLNWKEDAAIHFAIGYPF